VEKKTMNVVISNAKLAHYLIIFKEHVLFKLEVLAWRQKTSRREARRNEFKVKFNVLLETILLLSLADETSNHQ
jgi:hypothetical protein